MSKPPPPSGGASSSKASTSKTASIKILVLPEQNRPKRFIAPELPKKVQPMELENYVDPDPEIQKYLQEKTGIKRVFGNSGPIIKKREEWLQEENIKLKEEITKLREERDSFKKELRKTKAYISHRKYVANKKLKKEEEAEKSGAKTKDIDTFHPTSKQRICHKTWKKIIAEYGEENAKKIVKKIFEQHVPDDDGKKCLTPAETIQVMKNCNINILALRKLRHELIVLDIHNPFASDRAVNIERKRIEEEAGGGGAGAASTNGSTSGNEMESGESSNASNSTEVYPNQASMNNELYEHVNNRVYTRSTENYEPIYYIRE